MGYPIHIVDVFTDRALTGNQLAVVLDAGDIAPDVMQRVAREMNPATRPSEPHGCSRRRALCREMLSSSPSRKASAQSLSAESAGRTASPFG